MLEQLKPLISSILIIVGIASTIKSISDRTTNALQIATIWLSICFCLFILRQQYVLSQIGESLFKYLCELLNVEIKLEP